MLPNMLEFANPIPVETPLGVGMAIYATNSGTFENDTWTVALCNGGQIRHFTTNQLKVVRNGTFDITPKTTSPVDLSDVLG